MTEGCARATAEGDFSSIISETGSFAGEFWGAVATDGAAGRPTAILPISGVSVNARTRTRRGLKNEHPCSFPGVAPWHPGFGPGLASAVKRDARPSPLAEPALVVPLASTKELELSAALISASDIARAMPALVLSGLRLVSPTIAAHTPPTIVPSRTETTTTRMSRRKRAVRQKPPNSG